VTAAKAGPVTPIAALSGPGGGTGFGCKDPEGRNFAFVCGIADHGGDNPSVKDRPIKITHVNLNCADHDATCSGGPCLSSSVKSRSRIRRRVHRRPSRTPSKM
jgi:hypothetical protein